MPVIVATGAVPASMADALLGFDRAARRREFATVVSTLRTLFGRRPRMMRNVLAGRLEPVAT